MSRPRQEQQRLTIGAVAERVGVSVMTVSNVLNGKGRVGRETRARVLAAVEELGYVPNQAARRLVGTEIACVGLLYPAVESVFIEAMLSAVAVVAASKGVQLQIRAIAPIAIDTAADAAREMIRAGARAMLLLPPFAEHLGEQAATLPLGVPAAAIATADALSTVTTVRVDNRAAAHAITDHLVRGGRRRIAFLSGPQRHSDSLARLEGYRAALRTHGLPTDRTMEVEGDFTFQSALVAAETLLDLPVPPDAIVAGNDDMAAAILWMAHKRGIRLPDDLAVTGFDDTLIATRVWPPLTTVRQPIGDMAAAAMTWLADAVRSPHPLPVADVILPFSIIERGST